ncbi:hypothetical protein LXL04_024528 [Taraxacum kok-saghyz]
MYRHTEFVRCEVRLPYGNSSSWSQIGLHGISEKGLKCEDLNGVSEDMVVEKSGCSGAIWEIFRREEADRRTWQAKGCFKIKWQCNIKRGHFRNSGQIMGLVWVQVKVNIREQSDDQDYKNLELNGGYLVIKDQNAKNFNMRGQFGHYYPKLWTNLDKNFRSWGYFRENSDIFWGYFGQLLLSVCGSNYQQGHFWKADIYWGCWDRELLLLFKGVSVFLADLGPVLHSRKHPPLPATPNSRNPEVSSPLKKSGNTEHNKSG